VPGDASAPAVATGEDEAPQRQPEPVAEQPQPTIAAESAPAREAARAAQKTPMPVGGLWPWLWSVLTEALPAPEDVLFFGIAVVLAIGVGFGLAHLVSTP
jgi:hypothetical protein